MSLASSAKTVPTSAPVLTLEVWGATDRGMLPAHNEDTIWPEGAGAQLRDGSYLLIVADGVGGAEAGEQASSLATNNIVAYCQKPALTDPSQLLLQAVQAANQAVHTTIPQAATTVVVVLIKDGQAYIAHVGDSRAYLIRAGRVEFVTKDHTLTQRKIDFGRLQPEQARSDEDRNIITRSVGAEAAVQVDLDVCPMLPGDILLLCSDGLTDVLLDEDITRLIDRKSPRPAARRLIAEANRRGGPDNISAVVGRIGPIAPIPFNWPYLLLGLGSLLLLLACGLLLGGFYFNRPTSPAQAIAGLPTVTPTPVPSASPLPSVPASPLPTSSPPRLLASPFPTSTPLPTYTPAPVPTMNINQAPPIPPPTLPFPSTAVPGQMPLPQPSLLPPPTLKEPHEGDTAVRGRGMTFRWLWAGNLADNQGFEIRVWREGDPDHFGAFDARELMKYLTVEAGQVYVVAIQVEGASSVQLHGGGKYWWTVAVVQLVPYQRIGQEAPPQRIFYTIPGSSGSSGDHNEGGGGDDGKPDTAPNH